MRELIGHQEALEKLKKDKEKGKLGHAYLLSGQPHIGKARLALEFAMIVQCKQGGCHQCPTCIQLYKGSHPDLIHLKNEGQKILIEDVRALVTKLSISTFSPMHICILEDVERMTIQASNALLKILEEPPAPTLFLLTSAKPQTLLPTIKSRVNELFCPTPSKQEVFKILESNENASQLERIKALPIQQFPGMIIGLLENEEQLEQLEAIKQDLRTLLSKETSAAEVFKYTQTLSKDAWGSKQFLHCLLQMLHKEISTQPRRSGQKLQKVSQCIRRLEKNINKRLLLDHLLLSLRA